MKILMLNMGITGLRPEAKNLDMSICILVVTHKRYKMPIDSMYLPIQSGSALNDDLGYQRDDVGKNISHKNIAYNIMCAKYWAWKNLDADYIGISHYRRHFSYRKRPNKSFKNVLNRFEAEQIFKDVDIILPPKRYYPFFTIRSHYIYTKRGYIEMHKRDLDVLRDVISEYHSAYLESFDLSMNRCWYHTGSLFIMKSFLYNDYCEFIFSIGDEVERRLVKERPDLSRYIAALTELLLDTWIIKNNYAYKEIGLIEFERPNFFIKLILFLRRTITGYYKGT
jgi:hypothetical protein